MLPRLAVTGLRYIQPFLIDSVTNYMAKSVNDRKENHGYGLIGATALIYGGIAISTTYYQHKTYQLVTRFRGALVSLIYKATMSVAPGGTETLAPLTLIGTDVDCFTSALQGSHEIWASSLEVGIAVWLLARQVGPSALMPFAIACSESLTPIPSRLMLTIRQFLRLPLSGSPRRWAQDKASGIKKRKLVLRLHLTC